MSENLAGVLREVEEQIELRGCEVDGVAEQGDGVRVRIDAEVARFNRSAHAFRSAPQVSAHTSEEFLGAEWLGDVVVGAGIECFDFGLFLVAHGKHHDGDVAALANGAREFDTGDIGHDEIGNDQVGTPLVEDAESFLWIVCGAHVIALCGERGAQYACDLRLVIDDQDSFRHKSEGVSSPIMEKNTSHLAAALRFVVLTTVAALLAEFFSRVLRVNQTTVALAFLVLILVTAYRWRLTYSVYLSLLCSLLYNFFFLPPVGKLTISDPQNWIALGAFLSTSVLVSHLSDRERRQAQASEARRREVELLYKLSQKLLVQDEVQEFARNAPSIIASVIGMRAVALYVSTLDAVFYSDPERILVSAAELRTAEIDDGQPVTKLHGYSLIPLRMGMQHTLGQLAVGESDTSTAMLEAIGSLVSVALERAVTLERSRRLEAARESERLRSALVDSVTHDLRTPLTAIRAAATTLRDQRQMADAERENLVAVMEEESERLDRLIGQAVEMARLDSQSVAVQLEPQDVCELIEITLEQMQGELRNHPVEVLVTNGMPRVRMDRRLMQRVLQHLVENAAKYSPAGAPISVSAFLESGRLVFAVQDRGPGIDSEDLPFIFDKYFRGRRQKGSSRGTGMGLAISQAIVRAHEGGIDAECPAGGGTRFRFWIPVKA